MRTLTQPAAAPAAEAPASSLREPNFFIVGAARSGTSALWHYLRQHPDIFMPDTKEPSFFCRTMPPPWAVHDLDAYRALFAGAGNQRAIGEASVGYFASPESPGLIRAQYPDARIIIILRNPVDRAYSLYRLNCTLGVEPLFTFERALAQEDHRLQSEHFRRHNPYYWAVYMYYRSGLTASKLELFQQTFPRDQIHVVLFDDFKKNTVEATQGVFRFLGVDDSFTPSVPKIYESGFPLWPAAAHLMYRANRRRKASRGSGAAGRLDQALNAAFRLNLKLGARLRAGKVRPSTRRELLVRYKDDIHRTADLLGRDLSAWLAPLGR